MRRFDGSCPLTPICDEVDIIGSEPCQAQYLEDGVLGEVAGVLVPIEPLLLHCGQHMTIADDACRSVMGFEGHPEDVHGAGRVRQGLKGLG